MNVYGNGPTMTRSESMCSGAIVPQGTDVPKNLRSFRSAGCFRYSFEVWSTNKKAEESWQVKHES